MSTTVSTEKKPRLLWISDTPRYISVGQSRVTHQILERLKEEWEVTVAGFGDESIAQVPSIPHINVTYSVVNVWRPHPPKTEEKRAELLSVIERTSPDVVVFSHDIWLFPNIVEARQKFPQVKFVGYITLDGDPPYPEWKNLFYAYNTLVVPSEYTRRVLHERWFDLHIHMVPYGVDHDVYRMPRQGKDTLKREIYFASQKANHPLVLDLRNKFVGIFSGSNSTRKNLGAIYWAWKEFEVGKQDDVLFLMLAHSGSPTTLFFDYPPQAMMDVESLVWITQSLPESMYASLLVAADILVHPTLGEGFGLCVHPATDIYSCNGPKSIVNVSLGDTVLSQDGMEHKVTGITSRHSKGLWRVKCAKGYEVMVTPEHPFYTLASNGLLKESNLIWRNVKDLKVGDFIATPVPVSEEPAKLIDLAHEMDLLGVEIERDENFVWRRMGFSPRGRGLESLSSIMSITGASKKTVERAMKYVRVGKVVKRSDAESLRKVMSYLETSKWSPHLPQRYTRFVSVDSSFLEFLGWYTAEGSSTDECGSVELSLGPTGWRYIPFLSEVLQRLGGAVNQITCRDKKVIRLTLSNSVIAHLLRKNVGEDARRKRVPFGLWKCGRRAISYFKGLFLGDGGYCGRGYQYSTMSSTLMWQVRHWMTSIGLLPSIKRDKRTGLWRVGVYGKDALYLCTLFGIQFLPLTKSKTRRLGSSTKLAGRYILTPIREIEEVPYDGLVYDLSVESACSFVGNGLLLHNTVLESLASGTVPVVTNFSAVTDFCTEENSFLLDWEPIMAAYCMRRAVPRQEGLLRQIETAYAMWKSGELRGKREAGIATAAAYSWDRTATELNRILKDTLLSNVPLNKLLVGRVL